MGLFLLFIIICIGISIIAYCDSYDNEKKQDAIIGFTVPFIISLVIMGIIWGISYYNYVDAKSKLSYIEQYQSAIENYSKKGTMDFKSKLDSYNEVTDLKYQNYQTQMAGLIRDLRDNIINYNSIAVGKNTTKNGWVFNWCIVMPEKLEPLKMSDYIK